MKKSLFLLLSFVLLLTFSGAAWAFSDLQTNPHADKIRALQSKGILQGEADGKFNADGELTYAAGVSMLVRGLDLSLARFLFLKAPEAGDYFTKVKDGEWYTDAFIIAQVNGLDIPKDVDPYQSMTREQFAHHLFRAIEANGEHAYVMMYALIEDEADIAEEYRDSIQKLVVSKLISLDKENKFVPKAPIARGEAAAWLHDAIEFVRTAAEAPQPEPLPNPLADLALTVNEVNGDVNEVIVTAQAPHPGYGIRISSIVFIDGEAVIYTEPILPDPERMYPQVVTEVKAVTYVGADFKPVLPQTEWPE